jgi:transcription elongation factor Elf1
MAKSKESTDVKKKEIRCQRCGGRMIVEKFYDVNNVFWGWHCVICGEILDPVILLHRLSQDADLRIPENENEVLDMVKKYLQKGNKASKNSKQESKMLN